MSTLVRFCTAVLAAMPLLLAAAGSASAQSEGRLQAFMDNCLEGTGGDPVSDTNEARKCTHDYYGQCTQAAGETGAAQRQCWGELESYWAGVIAARTQRLEAGAPDAIKRYVGRTAKAAETYAKERCGFYSLLKAPWTGPASARCLTETLIDRAVDLQVMLENSPR